VTLVGGFDMFQIHCLDVTAGGLGVSSDSEGKQKVWETQTGDVRVSTCINIPVDIDSKMENESSICLCLYM
jgi:hypothetical protein